MRHGGTLIEVPAKTVARRRGISYKELSHTYATRRRSTRWAGGCLSGDVITGRAERGQLGGGADFWARLRHVDVVGVIQGETSHLFERRPHTFVRERAERRRLARNVVLLANVLGGFQAAEKPMRVLAHLRGSKLLTHGVTRRALPPDTTMA